MLPVYEGVGIAGVWWCIGLWALPGVFHGPLWPVVVGTVGKEGSEVVKNVWQLPWIGGNGGGDGLG